MLARGRCPEIPLPAVQAYGDLRSFGVLPRAGGSFDQPAGLIEEMRYVDSVVRKAERAEQEKREQEAARSMRRKARS